MIEREDGELDNAYAPRVDEDIRKCDLSVSSVVHRKG